MSIINLLNNEIKNIIRQQHIIKMIKKTRSHIFFDRETLNNLKTRR